MAKSEFPWFADDAYQQKPKVQALLLAPNTIVNAVFYGINASTSKLFLKRTLF